YFRVVYESLARSYQTVIADLEAVSGRKYGVLNIIGGGGRNRLLNRITARVTGKKVVAGPFEATSLGTIGAQLLFQGVAGNLTDIRRILSASAETSVFTA
ncbi:MAG: rhamnulokinase, partial [Planctomycetota bacterium]|nr:rhamnulokinase [Planctomycetota bacterium]